VVRRASSNVRATAGGHVDVLSRPSVSVHPANLFSLSLASHLRTTLPKT
jgi:hypothetical protein